MRTIRESIKLAVPVDAASDHWLRYDEFQRLLAPLTSADAAIARDPADWDSETIERRTDTLVLWKSEGGYAPASTAEFASVSNRESRITVTITLDRERPELDRRASRHLHEELAHFKHFVENRARRR